MKELAILLRKMQLLAHNAHNMVQGEDFLQFHSLLGDLYPAYESDYDDVIERIIGLYGSENLNLLEVQVAAVEQLKQIQIDMKDAMKSFQAINNCEKEMCDLINKLNKLPNVTEGSKQLIGDIANKSEMRQYKLNQIMKPKASMVKV